METSLQLLVKLTSLGPSTGSAQVSTMSSLTATADSLSKTTSPKPHSTIQSPKTTMWYSIPAHNTSVMQTRSPLHRNISNNLPAEITSSHVPAPAAEDPSVVEDTTLYVATSSVESVTSSAQSLKSTTAKAITILTRHTKRLVHPSYKPTSHPIRVTNNELHAVSKPNNVISNLKASADSGHNDTNIRRDNQMENTTLLNHLSLTELEREDNQEKGESTKNKEITAEQYITSPLGLFTISDYSLCWSMPSKFQSHSLSIEEILIHLLCRLQIDAKNITIHLIKCF